MKNLLGTILRVGAQSNQHLGCREACVYTAGTEGWKSKTDKLKAYLVQVINITRPSNTCNKGTTIPHCTHVQMIVRNPQVKDGTGIELHHLHDKVQQHLRALKAMGLEPPGPLITSVLELKLDPTTMQNSQESLQWSS